MISPTELAVFAVSDVMAADPVTVPPDAPVCEAVRLMNLHHIGAVLVGIGPTLHGIFTERDLLQLAGRLGSGWEMQSVGAWMTPDPFVVSPDAGWEDAVGHMERLGVRHLPVVDDGQVVGIISFRQLIARRTGHLNRLVEQRTHELSERDRQIQHQLQMAGRLLERALLPQAPPAGPDLAWAVRYSPLDSLGGDYYDFVANDSRGLGVLVADAAGHSVAAAMVAVMARIAFAEVARTASRPAEVLRGMNDRLVGLTEERFVTAFFARFDRPARRIICANAGHPLPVHYSARTGECRPIGPNGMVLGVMDEVDYKEHMIDVDPGDRIVFYTDGVIEAMDVGGDSFGADRLIGTVKETADRNAEDILAHLEMSLKEFRGGQRADDDVTILVAEVR